jgi:hypothetical protein
VSAAALGLGVPPSIDAAPPFPDPPFFAGPAIRIVRLLPFVISAAIDAAAPISGFSALDIGSSLLHGLLRDLDLSSISRNAPALNRRGSCVIFGMSCERIL